MPVPHRIRGFWSHRPYHVVIRSDVMGVDLTVPVIRDRILRELGTLGSQGSVSGGVALLAYGIMPSHIHLVLQARGAPGVALSKGKKLDSLMGKAFQVLFSNVARAVNRFMKRKGPVFSERYYARVLKSATEIVNAVKYVLWNRAPKQKMAEIHPCISLYAARFKTVPLAALGYAREVLERSFLKWILQGIGS